MRYGKLYKVLFITLGICFIFLAIKREYKTLPPEEQSLHKDKILTSRLEEDRTKVFDQEIKTSEIKETESMVVYPDVSETISEESIAPERYSPYGDDIQIDCYFTNTENTIDSKDVLPLYAQETLTEAAQRWFNENSIAVNEIKCIDGTVLKEENSISFKVESSGLVFLFIYDLESRSWSIEKEGVQNLREDKKTT